MSRRKIVLICLIALVMIATIALYIVESTGIGSFIELPSVETVTAIEIYQTTDWQNRSEPILLTDQDELSSILTALSTARQTSYTSYSAANETPAEPNYLTIMLRVGAEGMRRYHLYKEDTVYVEYEGLYRLEKAEFTKIQEICDNHIHK